MLSLPGRCGSGDAGSIGTGADPTLRVRALGAAGTGVERDNLRAEIIEALLPLAHRLARRYRGLGIPLEDLRQVAATGLIRSVDAYQPARGAFVSYAVPTITGELRRYLRDRAWAVRPPRRLQELALRVHHASSELCVELGRTPTSSELADLVCAPVEEVHRATGALRAYMAVSLDSAPTSGSTTPLVELLPETSSDIDTVVDRLALSAALGILSERERTIIRLRFLDELTQQEIARRLGISQAHVSGMLARTLLRLRHTLSAEGGAGPAVGPYPLARPGAPVRATCARRSTLRVARSRPSRGRPSCRRHDGR